MAASPLPRLQLPRQETVDSTPDTSATECSVEDSCDVVRLEVPSFPKVRSSSFDASTLHQGEMSDNEASIATTLLQVPSVDQWSGSDNSASERDGHSLLRVDLPKCFRRRSLEIPRLCIHCVHLESLSSQESICSPPSTGTGKIDIDEQDIFSYGSSTDSDDEEDDDEESDRESKKSFVVKKGQRSPMIGHRGPSAQNFTSGHRQSWDSSALVASAPDSVDRRHSCSSRLDENNAQTAPAQFGQKIPAGTTQLAAAAATTHDSEKGSSESNPSLGSSEVIDRIFESNSGVAKGEIITLQVPLIKPRSSSLDASCSMTLPYPEADIRRSSCDYLTLTDPLKQQRSTSVDVSLPTDELDSYRAITHYTVDNSK